MREDEEGEYYHFVSLCKATKEERQLYGAYGKQAKKSSFSGGHRQDCGQGRRRVALFTNEGRMMAPVQRVNVDFPTGMLEELDRAAEELNISRQAVIKTLLPQGLDQAYLARGGRRTAKRV